MATDTTSTNNGDGTLQQGSPTTNYGSQTKVAAYCYNASAPQRFVTKFTLPSGSGTITDVTLNFKSQYQGGNVGTLNVHTMTQTAWTEGGATWNKYDGTNDWTAAGGDYTGTVIDSVSTASAGNWNILTLMGAGATNPLTINWSDVVYLLVKVSNESNTGLEDGGEFDSKDSGTPGNRPYLEITYTTGAAFKPRTMMVY
jgi:hypothetical protein